MMNNRLSNGRFEKQYSLSTNRLIDLYSRFGSIKNVASHLRVSSEYIRKEFIKRNIPYVKKTVYNCNECFFDNDNPNVYYWAGMLASDGNVSKDNDISLALSVKDIEHVNKFKTCLKSNSPVTIFKRQGTAIICDRISNQNDYCRFRIRSHNMAKSLKDRFNIVPAKTKIYTIPQNVKNSEYIRHFIRGYFDGDGWFSKSNNRLTLGFCGNYSTINTIRDVLSYKNFGFGSVHKQKNIYKLTYAKQHDVLQISNYMYDEAEYYLDRKFNIAKTAKQYDDQTVILNLERDKILHLLNKHETVAKTAEILGCSKNGLRNYMKKFKIGIYA